MVRPFFVWVSGRERVALLTSQEAAEALVDALEDAWDQVFLANLQGAKRLRREFRRSGATRYQLISQ